MSVFADKKYENLDFLSQITETIDAPVNAVLASLPEIKSFSYEEIVTILGDSYSFRMDVGSLVRKLLQDSGINYTALSYEERQLVFGAFKLETSGDLILDFETGTLHGEVILTKTVNTLADDVLQKMLGAQGIDELRYINYQSASHGRFNEILDLVGGCDEAKKTRSINNKIRFLKRRLMKIFVDNEWRIRDNDLANKISRWARVYIETGNLAALTNFCKVKVMTHNGGPIYSIVEEPL